MLPLITRQKFQGIEHRLYVLANSSTYNEMLLNSVSQRYYGLRTATDSVIGQRKANDESFSADIKGVNAPITIVLFTHPGDG